METAKKIINDPVNLIQPTSFKSDQPSASPADIRPHGGKLNAAHKCTKCDRSFSSSYLLKTHNASKSHKQAIRNKDCKVCGRVFDTFPSLRNHFKNAHGMSCDICGKVVATKGGLALHRRIHKKLLEAIGSAENRQLTDVGACTAKPVSNSSKACPQPREFSPLPNGMTLFPDCEAIARAGNGFCKLCPSVQCDDLSVLVLHVRSHLVCLVRCPVCGRNFSQMEHLWEHVYGSLSCHMAINNTLGHSKLVQSKSTLAAMREYNNCSPKSESHVGKLNSDSDSDSKLHVSSEEKPINCNPVTRVQTNYVLTRSVPLTKSMQRQERSASKMKTITHSREGNCGMKPNGRCRLPTITCIDEPIVVSSDSEIGETTGTLHEENSSICPKLPSEMPAAETAVPRLEDNPINSPQNTVQSSPVETKLLCHSQPAKRTDSSLDGSSLKVCKEVDRHPKQMGRQRSDALCNISMCYINDCSYETKYVSHFCQHRMKVHGEETCSCGRGCRLTDDSKPITGKSCGPCSESTESLENGLTRNCSTTPASGDVSTPLHQYKSQPDHTVAASSLPTHKCPNTTEPGDHEQPDTTANQEFTSSNNTSSCGSIRHKNILESYKMNVVHSDGYGSCNKRELRLLLTDCFAGSAVASVGQPKMNGRITRNTAILDKKWLHSEKASQPTYNSKKALKTKRCSFPESMATNRKRKATSQKPSGGEQVAVESQEINDLARCSPERGSKGTNQDLKMLVTMSRNVGNREHHAEIRVDFLESNLPEMDGNIDGQASWITNDSVVQDKLPSAKTAANQQDVPELASMIDHIEELFSGDQPVTSPGPSFEPISKDLHECEQIDAPPGFDFSFSGCENGTDADCAEDRLQLDESVTSEFEADLALGTITGHLNGSLADNVTMREGVESNLNDAWSQLDNCQTGITFRELMSQFSLSSSPKSQFNEPFNLLEEALLTYDQSVVEAAQLERSEEIQKGPLTSGNTREDPPVSMSAEELSHVERQEPLDTNGHSPLQTEMLSETQSVNEGPNGDLVGLDIRSQTSQFHEPLDPLDELMLVDQNLAGTNKLEHPKEIEKDPLALESTRENLVRVPVVELSHVERDEPVGSDGCSPLDIEIPSETESTNEEPNGDMEFDDRSRSPILFFSALSGTFPMPKKETSGAENLCKVEAVKSEVIDWGFNGSDEAQEAIELFEHSPVFKFGRENEKSPVLKIETNWISVRESSKRRRVSGRKSLDEMVSTVKDEPLKCLQKSLQSHDYETNDAQDFFLELLRSSSGISGGIGEMLHSAAQAQSTSSFADQLESGFEESSDSSLEIKASPSASPSSSLTEGPDSVDGSSSNYSQSPRCETWSPRPFDVQESATSVQSPVMYISSDDSNEFLSIYCSDDELDL